ncbi:hypothetical protein C8Q80DRAFT_427056 [Daedaleopsis nitida]|nr:hypothetical protein C8Q80DRAFT_427056 [Daedaleopsis nitida]
MPRLCGGSQSNLAERRTIFPRQTLSIVPVATGTDSAPTGTPATDDTGATSPAPSGALTSAPSSPTGRQDPRTVRTPKIAPQPSMGPILRLVQVTAFPTVQRRARRHLPRPTQTIPQPSPQTERAYHIYLLCFHSPSRRLRQEYPCPAAIL